MGCAKKWVPGRLATLIQNRGLRAYARCVFSRVDTVCLIERTEEQLIASITCFGLDEWLTQFPCPFHMWHYMDDFHVHFTCDTTWTISMSILPRRKSEDQLFLHDFTYMTHGRFPCPFHVTHGQFPCPFRMTLYGWFPGPFHMWHCMDDFLVCFTFHTCTWLSSQTCAKTSCVIAHLS